MEKVRPQRALIQTVVVLALLCAVTAAHGRRRHRAQPGQGQVQRHRIQSRALGGQRELFVYLPPGYNPRGGKRYPVLYMQDGQNLLGRRGWDVTRAVERETRAGRARPAIIVGVNHAGAGRIHEYSPSHDRQVGGGGGAKRYLRFVTDELMPWGDRTFRTRGDKRHTVIGGSSMGGLMSLYAGLKRPDVFGGVMAMSPSLWWNGKEMQRRVASRPIPRGLRVYLDSGGAGPSADGSRDTNAMRDLLHRKGMRFGRNLFHWFEGSHPHSEGAWRARFPRAFSTMFPAR